MFGIYLQVKFYIPSSNVRIVIALKITSKWRFYMLLCYILQTNTSGKCSQCSKQVMVCTVCNSTQRQRNFNLSKISRPLLGPTKPPTQRLPGALYPRVRTSHVHSALKFRMSGAVPWPHFLQSPTACTATIWPLPNTATTSHSNVCHLLLSIVRN
jgi:hypothetical protein